MDADVGGGEPPHAADAPPAAAAAPSAAASGAPPHATDAVPPSAAAQSAAASGAPPPTADAPPAASAAPSAAASASSPAASGSARGAAGGSLSAAGGSLSAAGAPSPSGEAPSVVVKVALVGDAGIGKTSLMVRYVHRSFAQTAATLGVDFLERVIELPQARVTLSIWDLGGSFQALLPMVTQDAVAVAFLFDVTQPASLHSVRSWYRDVRALNKAALPFLVGTKHDALAALPDAQQAAVVEKARGYAKAMKCPLLLTSAATGLNINALFKLIFQMAFGLEIDVKRSETVAF